MTEVVEESLKADAMFRHLTVMPTERMIQMFISKNWERYWS